MEPRRGSIVATIGVPTPLAPAPAFAEGDDDQASGRDARVAAATASVTLSRAVGGAARAGYESRDGATVIRVDVVKDRTRLETRIDASSGKVPATTGRDDEQTG